MDEEPTTAVIVPSPAPLTESDDEERPPSAQIPDASNAANVDSERPAISATEAFAAVGAVQSGMDPEPDEADKTTDSYLESADKVRKRKCRPGVKKPRIQWHTIQVFDRDAMNDEATQASLTEVARVEYEKGGTGFPPGTFMYFMLR
jgi:hypothetical protein